MAVALDASSPARVSGVGASGVAVTTASFTAPTDAVLVACIEADGDGIHSETMAVSDSGGLAWTLVPKVERTWAEATTGGYAGIFTAKTTSAVGRTVTITMTFTGGTNFRRTVQVYVFTGADLAGTPIDTTGANNEGGSGTNNLTTTSITPGANGVHVCAGCDWAALGAATSSDLKGIDSVVGSGHAEFAGAIDVIDGWHTTTSGVGSTANLDAAAGTPQWKWIQITIREAAGGGGTTVECQAWCPVPQRRSEQNITY